MQAELAGLAFALLIAFADWLALRQKWRRLDYLAKPGVILALLAWQWLATPGSLGRAPLIWVQLGLAFSLLGDVLLMLPAERFLGGLTAFLAAHLTYALAFNHGPIATSPLMLIPVLAVLLIAGLFYQKLQSELGAGGRKKLRLPVGLYTLAIAVMTISALFTFFRPFWISPSPMLIGLGSLLFFASDALLAWNRFIEPIQHGRLKVRITYHLGQVLIVAGSTWPALNV